MDSITSLPPPPPSPSRLSEDAESDSEPLPPPPPEMFRSTLSLDSLPPPPAPGELPACNTPDLMGSCLSLASLPPPPSPLVGETSTIRRAKPKHQQPQQLPLSPAAPENGAALQNFLPPLPQLNLTIANNSPHNSYPGSNASTPTYAPTSPSFAPPPPFVPPPAYGSYNGKAKEPARPVPGTDTVRRSALKQSSGHYASPPYLAELKTGTSPQSQRRVTIQEPPVSPKAKTGTGKKISFNLPPENASPALPQRKPMPPMRSDSTRLTSPKKLAASDQVNMGWGWG